MSSTSKALVTTLPVLYSLQNCPYAMRARLVLMLAQQKVRLRAVSLKDKPAEMLLISPKGTVPILVIENSRNSDYDQVDQMYKEQVIDESLAIMLWALEQNDSENLLYSHDENALAEMLKIIEESDAEFKPTLEKYKRAKRYHGNDLEACRLECEPFIQELEQRLAQHEFFMGSTPSLLDYALLPFIRQFSRVNKPVFSHDRYTNLRRWLSYHLQSRLFSRAMFKYPLWLDNHEECILGE